MRTTMMMRMMLGVLLVTLIAPRLAMAQAETVTYYYTDAIGSVRMTTDGSGGSVTRYDYLPFGEPWPSAGLDVRQFAGKERDAETELNYFGARYYASRTGQFTTVDPVLNADSALIDPQLWNRYAYSKNNPLQFIDPDGRQIRLAQSPERERIYATFARLRSAISGVFTDGDSDPNIFQRAGRILTDFALSTVLPTNDAESLPISLGVASQSGGAAATGKIASLINRDKGLVRLAEEAGASVQSGIDALTTQLSRGNLNPGIGTKHLFGNVFYARARDGARVFFRQVGDIIEILAKSSKHNEERVIRKLQELYP